MLGNVCFLNLYLRARGSLGVRDKRGRTALHHSAANGHRHLTASLAEFGAFENLLETKDKSGNSPLLTAVRHNRAESIKVLL